VERIRPRTVGVEKEGQTKTGNLGGQIEGKKEVEVDTHQNLVFFFEPKTGKETEKRKVKRG